MQSVKEQDGQQSGNMKETNKKPEIRTLQAQAWKRAMNKSKPNAGTPHDWEDYENNKEEE